MERLHKLFTPESVAVVGASEKVGTVGRAILENLLTTFKGEILPVNYKYDKILGLRCYRSVKDLPRAPDLAVIAVPASSTPEVVRDLCELGVKFSIVVSAGFKEVGPEGARLEAELVSTARSCGMRILGPNCLGVYDPWSGLDTIFNPNDRQAKPKAGGVAFLSQSGALGAAILDWLAEADIGLSKFVSYGNAADIKEWELVEYLAEDPRTTVIALYVEGVEDGRKFMESVRRAVARGKPVVILKGGRTEAGGRAVASHTGSLAGRGEVFSSAVRQAGAVTVDSLGDLINVLKLFARGGIPKGRRVGIVTNGGGAGVLSVDAVESLGLSLAKFVASTVQRLRDVLPAAASVDNPVDILGDAPPERYIAALEAVAKDPNVDSIIVITLMQSPAFDPKRFAELMRELRDRLEKPVVLVAPGGSYTVNYSKELEKELAIPYYRTPEEAVRALKLAAEWYDRYRSVKDRRDRSSETLR